MTIDVIVIDSYRCVVLPMFWFSLFQFLCLRWTFGKVELIWFPVQHPITQASYGLGVCEQGVWKGWKSSGWSPNGSIVGRESICACDRQRWRQHTHIVTTTAVAIRGQDQPNPCPWADSEACIHILLFLCFLISDLFFLNVLGISSFLLTLAIV